MISRSSEHLILLARALSLPSGNEPFPWQVGMLDRFLDPSLGLPSGLDIPTGLGKTSIVTIWLVALALRPNLVPRRLVYVVNRRTVVDQTTTEVLKLCDALGKDPKLAEIRAKLTDLAALPLPTPDASPLAVSTLRGQLADNNEWCADPTRPAVVVGTVDMIGSGLLFSRYTRGFKARPLHAGFLGQDVLLIHDEAHLEPCFQRLLEGIVAAQKADGDPRPLRLLQLTATSRTGERDASPPFKLTEADRANKIVAKRINAIKRLSLVALGKDEKLDAKLVALAKDKSDGRAVVIFIRSVETAMKVANELDKGDHKGKVAILTGTMRGKERDELVSRNPIFQRFLPGKDRVEHIEPSTGTVYLVATSAGEVGVNLSADDLVCDLSTYESMAQRFGRVNRFGDRDDSKIIVVHETQFDDTQPLEVARNLTLKLLQDLNNSANPAALDTLHVDKRATAFSPSPQLRFATDVQFDAWALTSIRQPIAARPSVAPYLHGEAEWQPPKTHLAWRDDRDFQHIPDDSIEDFLEIFPLLPRELLRDKSHRIAETLGSLVAARLQSGNPITNAWLIDELGNVKALPLTPFAFSAKRKKLRTKAEEEKLKNVRELLAGVTLILPASLGGLDAMGTFSPSAKSPASDCSGIERRERDTRETGSVFSCDISSEDDDEPRYLLWFAPPTGSRSFRKVETAVPETLDAHTEAVVANAAAIAAKLFQSSPSPGGPDLGRCLIVAAQLHDLGKNRAQWQCNLGNLSYDPANSESIFAKSGGKMHPRNVREHYRHEFGSLLDAELKTDFRNLNEVEREITLHIIAAHHGRARPHFSAEEAFDYSISTTATSVASATPHRFALLQKRFGRWGLAWLESLLRAADYAASAGIVAQNAPAPEANPPASRPYAVAQSATSPQIKPSATLLLNPSNPGHYFACCGIFELSSRPNLHPDALAWFEQDPAIRQWRFHLANTAPLVELLELITSAEITADSDSADADPDQEDTEDANDGDEGGNEKDSEKEAAAPPLRIGEPFDLRLDWWTTPSHATAALKVWAGSMKVLGIARSMSYTVAQSLSSYQTLERILFETCPPYDPVKIAGNKQKVETAFLQAVRKAEKKQADALQKAVGAKKGEKLEKEKIKIAKKFAGDLLKAQVKRDSANLLKGAKKEPFCFDANRGPNSDARDVGFSANDLSLESFAAPAAELLTLVGLQRAIPQPSGDRLFDYHLWRSPIPISLLASAVNGFTESQPAPGFRFESWYRTSQRKHKAFLPAQPL